MRVALRPIHVVIDADDVDALRDFWIEALGYEEFGAFEQYRSAIPAGGASGPKFIFQKVPEGRTSGKNRLHIDIEVGARRMRSVDRTWSHGRQRRNRGCRDSMDCDG